MSKGQSARQRRDAAFAERQRDEERQRKTQLAKEAIGAARAAQAAVAETITYDLGVDTGTFVPLRTFEPVYVDGQAVRDGDLYIDAAPTQVSRPLKVTPDKLKQANRDWTKARLVSRKEALMATYDDIGRIIQSVLPNGVVLSRLDIESRRDGLGVRAVVGMSDRIIGYAGTANPNAAAERRAQEAEAKCAKMKETFDRLQAAPAPVGTILGVSKDKATLQAGPLVVEVPKPEGVEIFPGDPVRYVQETMQIVAKADLPPVGQECSVEELHDDGTITVGGGQIPGSRRVAANPTVLKDLRAGDHVIVEELGKVAIAKGRPRSNAQQLTSVETPITWDDIGGCTAAKEALREALEFPTLHRELYASYGKRPAKGALLYGPPGCGKTMLGKALASSISGTGGFFLVKGPELLSMYYGETERAIREVFARAKEWSKENGRPAVIMIDEADALLTTRGDRYAGNLATTVPAFLTEMDGISSSGAFVLLSTNRADALDPAIVRDGRIDRKIKIDRPNRAEAAELLRIFLSRHPLANPLDAIVSSTVDAAFGDHCVVREIGQIGPSEDQLRPLILRLRDVMSGAVLRGICDRAVVNALTRDRLEGLTAARGLTIDDCRNGAFAAASELADTDLREAVYTCAVAAVGEAKAKFHQEKGHLN